MKIKTLFKAFASGCQNIGGRYAVGSFIMMGVSTAVVLVGVFIDKIVKE